MKAMTSRRSFLKGFSAASFFAGGGCASIISSRSPNSLLCHACIGTANMARYDMERFLANPRVKIAAICDVDADFLSAARKFVPDEGWEGVCEMALTVSYRPYHKGLSLVVHAAVSV